MRKQLSSAGGGDEVVEPRGLGRHDAPPERRQLVIAPAFVRRAPRLGAGRIPESGRSRSAARSIGRESRPDVAVCPTGGEIFLIP
jgi:hypothetical protein